MVSDWAGDLGCVCVFLLSYVTKQGRMVVNRARALADHQKCPSDVSASELEVIRRPFMHLLLKQHILQTTESYYSPLR